MDATKALLLDSLLGMRCGGYDGGDFCIMLISLAAKLCYQTARIQPTLFSAPYEVEDPYPSLSDYHDYEPQVRFSKIRIIIRIVFLSSEVHQAVLLVTITVL